MYKTLALLSFLRQDGFACSGTLAFFKATFNTDGDIE